MQKLKAIISSMRLRTIPLSLSGTIIGVGYGILLPANSDPSRMMILTFFLILTTISLQTLSNLSNELGDTLHGTDSTDRQGPKYSLQEGKLTIKDIKTAIITFLVLSVISGLLMIFYSFGFVFNIQTIVLIILGASAILGAMKYTLGKNPYGYRGLGDIAVFIFFGLVSVLGSYFIITHSFNPFMVAPAAAIGFFSVGVLNVNNIRDMESDAGNRVTVAIKLGLERAKKYQTYLIILGWVCVFVMRCGLPLPLLALPLFIRHLKVVRKENGRELDKALPLLVIATFIVAVLIAFLPIYSQLSDSAFALYLERIFSRSRLIWI